MDDEPYGIGVANQAVRSVPRRKYLRANGVDSKMRSYINARLVSRKTESRPKDHRQKEQVPHGAGRAPGFEQSKRAAGKAGL